VTIAPGDRVIDYSYARPSLQKVASAGAVAVVRYTAGAASLPGHPSYPLNRGKLITSAEFKAITAVGLDVLANDEWFTDRVTQGAAAGKEDARAAATVWKLCGLSKGSAIIVSWDASPVRSKWRSARAYLLAYAAELETFGYKLGVYAGTPFLKYAASNVFGRFVVRFLWRPNAGSWSNDGLPYQPDTSTPEVRAALVKLALTKTPATLWQTGNYWFGKSADENLVLRVPVGASLETAAAGVKKPPKPGPKPPVPIPDPVTGKELTLTPDEKAYFDAKFSQIEQTVRGAFSDSSGKAHTLRAWLSSLAGKKVDIASPKK